MNASTTGKGGLDAAFAVALVMLGVAGLQSVFVGWRFLAAGLIGALLGAVSERIMRSTAPFAVRCAFLPVGFVVLGAYTQPADAFLSLAPTLASTAAVFESSVSGWVRLLTTAPPVGDADGLLAVPYVLALVGALAALLLGRSPRRVAMPILAPVSVLAASVLLGTRAPGALLLQGGVFLFVALSWLAVRANRVRPLSSMRLPRRTVQALAFLVPVALAAVVAGPLLAPGGTRVILRDYTEPPFEPRSYGSPLNGFRRYLTEAMRPATMFSIEGLPRDVPVRLATLDHYDGIVWSVQGRDVRQSGRFERTGTRLPIATTGRQASVVVTVKELAAAASPLIWVPSIGLPSEIRFGGDRATELDRSFRFNRVSAAVAVPDGLATDDRIALGVRLPPVVTEEKGAALDLDTNIGLPVPASVPAGVKDKAAEIVAGEANAYAKAKRLEAFFRNGYYSDGGPGSGIPPGHSVSRLNAFLGTQPLVGNAEQYAATMALMARALGMPARVVVGFRPDVKDADGVVDVRGADADAWVEIAFVGAGWVAFRPTPDRDRVPEPQPKDPLTRIKVETQEPEPADPYRPPDDGSATAVQQPPEPPDPPGWKLPRWLALALKVVGFPAIPLLTAAGAIAAIKRRRRARRRNAGTPALRIHGGWSELLDRCRDHGMHVPRRSTRSEIALALGGDAYTELAELTEHTMFGAATPSMATAEAYWQRIDAEVAALARDLGRADRWRATFNVASLLRA